MFIKCIVSYHIISHADNKWKQTELEEAGTHKSAQTYTGEKPSVAYVCSQRQYCVLSEDDTDVMTLNFESDPKINGFPELIVEHLYVKFSDPSCIGFWDIVWKNRQTNSSENSTPRLSSAWVNVKQCTIKAGIYRVAYFRQRIVNDRVQVEIRQWISWSHCGPLDISQLVTQ